MDGKVHAEPSTVAADGEQVVVDGPDGVAVTLTAEAAEETGHRLISSASEAAGFKHLQRRGKDTADKEDAGSTAPSP